MKTSSETAQATNVQTAWGCLTANLAVPGSGSVMARRRVSGVIQAAISVTGMALTMTFGLRFFLWYAANRLRLEDVALDDPVGALTEMWLAVRWAMIGIGLFGFAWLWALLTSVRVLRAARRAGVPRKAAPPRL
jgi:hypothetical protein